MILDQIFLPGHIEYVYPYEYYVVMDRRQPEPWCWMQERRQGRVIGGHPRPECAPRLNWPEKVGKSVVMFGHAKRSKSHTMGRA